MDLARRHPTVLEALESAAHNTQYVLKWWRGQVLIKLNAWQEAYIVHNSLLSIHPFIHSFICVYVYQQCLFVGLFVGLLKCTELCSTEFHSGVCWNTYTLCGSCRGSSFQGYYFLILTCLSKLKYHGREFGVTLVWYSNLWCHEIDSSSVDSFLGSTRKCSKLINVHNSDSMLIKVKAV